MSALLEVRAHAGWAQFSVIWLWSRRLTEPPRPANIGLRPSYKVSGPEGVAGAIGKPPFRVRRTRNSNLWRLCRHPSPPSTEGVGPSAAADGGRYPTHHTPQQKVFPSVSLPAHSSLCGGSLLTALPTKPPLKGEVPAYGGRKGSFPMPQRSRRLCQPP